MGGFKKGQGVRHVDARRHAKAAHLRRKRIQAHATFDRLWKDGLMSKRQAYLWLQAKLGLPEAEAHIGKFSTFRCEQVIQLCGSFFPTASRAA